MYRGTARMYAYDALALSVATLAVREDEAATLSLIQQSFLYLPFMHVENVTLQQAMVAKYESLVRLARERSPGNVGYFEYALDYAVRHRDIVATYGRFPHRNAILGRSSTEAELEFLTQEGSGF